MIANLIVSVLALLLAIAALVIGLLYPGIGIGPAKPSGSPRWDWGVGCGCYPCPCPRPFSS